MDESHNTNSGKLLNRNAETHDVRGEGGLILIRLRQGDYFKTACARAGVPYSTAKRWLRLGRGEVGSMWGNYVCREEHVWFYENVESALADVECLAVDVWINAVKHDNWQAARDFLARRFPRRWGLSVRRDPDLSGEAPAEIDLICGDEAPIPSGETEPVAVQAAPPPPDPIPPASADAALTAPHHLLDIDSARGDPLPGEPAASEPSMADDPLYAAYLAMTTPEERRMIHSPFLVRWAERGKDLRACSVKPGLLRHRSPN